jgi:hypothetical protein
MANFGNALKNYGVKRQIPLPTPGIRSYHPNIGLQPPAKLPGVAPVVSPPITTQPVAPTTPIQSVNPAQEALRRKRMLEI